jgi:hypothetical protein
MVSASRGQRVHLHPQTPVDVDRLMRRTAAVDRTPHGTHSFILSIGGVEASLAERLSD